jgi:UDP-GlcNAc:undecaprenyl-phosphate GlcNAc-1-phosphate transferase
MHTVSIPRCGGGAIFLSVVLSWIVFGEWSPFLQRVLIGATVVFLMGLADDVLSLPPWGKLFSEVAAAMIGVGTVRSFAGVVAVVWVVMLVNAHNFIDGIDGLLAGCAIVESCALGLMLFLIGARNLILPTILLGVSCMGFRFYNRHPAQIFAGDCGSGTIGFLFGMLSLPLFYEMRWSAGWLSPLFLFAYPIADLCAAVIRRVLQGRSPFDADKGHLHHRLCAFGLDQISAGRILILLSALLSFVGIWTCTGEYPMVASFTCVIAASALTEIGALFYRE